MIIEFPAPGWPWSINRERSKHWSWRAHQAAEWRQFAYIAVREWNDEVNLSPSTVTVTLPVPDRKRRDPHNYGGAVKAIVDGLVDAGCWPDDTPEWVTVNEPVLERRFHRVKVTGRPVPGLVTVKIEPRP